ncbi:hypothetical protein TVAG_112360 [Trichomonas vaginalis G3]|uniref:Uncharacterized protein n=1 Tax=Trichomonas vaginalis (strain ATCC PRA-98 / G3) TaxID=412133 RepID=A2G6V0_TRIV3|nr:hypothetical protein TVAG_112360 [Trichomonas vaginalis G3]|eukprot:XP_001300047.1 hypothetical protein [Trichomonas vaginalis G3]
MNEEQEKEYIAQKREKSNNIINSEKFNLIPGTKVRVIKDDKPFKKKRLNLSRNYYILDSAQGNGFLIRAEDDSVAFYPRHKLVESSNGRLAKTLDDAKRGVIAEILSYNSRTDKYKVRYEGGVEDEIKSNALRESKPTHLGPMEREFWKGKEIPNKIKKYFY